MMSNGITLESYREVAPKGAVDLLYKLAKRLEGRSILHVNSTRVGGGVAEILNRFVPLFNELGIKADWDVLTGSPLFYSTLYMPNGQPKGLLHFDGEANVLDMHPARILPKQEYRHEDGPAWRINLISMSF